LLPEQHTDLNIHFGTESGTALAVEIGGLPAVGFCASIILSNFNRGSSC
jgi:hypothetical protein